VIEDVCDCEGGCVRCGAVVWVIWPDLLLSPVLGSPVLDKVVLCVLRVPWAGAIRGAM